LSNMIIKKIKKWYKGNLVYQNKDDDTLVRIPGSYYEQPPLAKLIKWLGDFWLKHWKWILTTLIAIVLGIVALFIRTG